MALLGGMLFAQAPLAALTLVLGAFLILIVVIRHLPKMKAFKTPLKGFALIGAASSFLSALLGSVGPLMAPFFLAYGLVKGAYIGTEALSTVVMHLVKLIAYRESAVLPMHAVVSGLALGPIMVAGSFAGKRVVDRLPERVFVRIIDLALLAAGTMFLIGWGK